MRRLALGVWSLWALTTLLFAVQLILASLNGRHGNFVSNSLFAIDFLAVATVGALIAWKQSRNPIGWLLLSIATAMGAVFASDQYAIYAYATRPGALPAGEWASWLASWAWLFPILGLGALLPLYFPNGELPSNRWRPILWAASLLMVGASATYALTPKLEVYRVGRTIDNPIGLDAFARITPWVDGVGIALFMCVAIASLSSLIVRFRRAAFEERQQIKWLGFAVVLVGPLNIGVTALIEAIAIEGFGDSSAGQIISFLAILAVPVAIALAILKYQLYDIDVLINRTLVYSLLTASLAIVYVSGVAVLQQLFRPFTGTSSLAVAVSTLGVAALFRPAQGRTQELIDRRFYRSKYDAAKMLDEFAARVRSETDLERLTGELVEVVRSAVHPTQVTIWLRRAAN